MTDDTMGKSKMMQDRHDYQAILQTPFGALGVTMSTDRLKSIDFLPEENGSVAPVDEATRGVTAAIQGYLNDPNSTFPFELLLEGTDFQQRVWQRLMQIPVGTTVTYGQLAEELNSSARAIGNACRANPCPLVVPCHRVVGKTGLGGFAGKTSGPKLQLKIWLLSHESGVGRSQLTA